MDFSRRNFMLVGVTSLTGLPGDVDSEVAQQSAPDNESPTAAQLAGIEADLPGVESVFFDNKQFYAYVYDAIDAGKTFYTDDSLAEWRTLAVNGSSLSLVAVDLSGVDASDGEIYRHDGSSSITADGASTAATGYYCWSEDDSEWKSVVAF